MRLGACFVSPGFLLLLIASAAWNALAANMTPVAVTGFNRDVVVENTATGAPFYTWAEEMNPGEGTVFYQSGLPGYQYGLPATGQFVSETGDGTVFQFQPYTAENALVLSWQTSMDSGTLTLSKPSRFLRVAFTAHSGSGGGTPAVTFNFADGSSYSTVYNASDWFNNAGYALRGVERVYLSGGRSEGAPTNPRFYQTTVNFAALGLNGILSSITFNKAGSAGATAIYSLSGEIAPDVPVTIQSGPADVSTVEGTPAVFTLQMNGTPTPTVLWYRNSVLIPSVSNAVYVLAAPTINDHNALFQAIAWNDASGTRYYATSRVATLRVSADTNPPVLLGALSLGLQEVRLMFSESMAGATATNTSNFTLSSTNGPLSILGARLEAGGTNVVLSVSNMVPGFQYTVAVSNLADRSAAGNVLAATNVQFYAISLIPVSIGDAALPGEIRPAGGGYDIVSGGSGAAGNLDQVQFGYQPRQGDFDIRVRVRSLDLSNPWAQAGLMARATTDPDSVFAAVVATPTISGIYFASRGLIGAEVFNAGYFPVNFPQTWLRLARTGSTFTGYGSVDGVTWVRLSRATLPLGPLVYVGPFASSQSPAEAVTAEFRDLSEVTSTSPASALSTREPLGQCSRLTSLVISEIMYHPNEATDPDEKLEFIEIFNSRGEPEDISGYSIDGDVRYVFPPNTVIPSGGFLVVARSPSDLKGAYGIQNVLGPWVNAGTQSLPNGSGEVTLLHRTGGVFLQVEYTDEAPWPVAADGTGHSLVLTRPSLGERDPAAWEHSATVGGSPGEWNGNSSDALDGVVINEFLARANPSQQEFVELYNHTPFLKNLSGAWLSDSPNRTKYQLPAGTFIQPGSFLNVPLASAGFNLNGSGERLFLVNSNETRVVDAVQFGPQRAGVSNGRYPNGGPEFYPFAAPTPGGSNNVPLQSPVVINELLYHPVSEDDDEQFVELHNRTAAPVVVGGWRLQDGIAFTFPTNAVVPANGFLVVARNASKMRTNYAHLNATNCLGDFDGTLAHGGERVALSIPVAEVATNSGVVATNITYAVVNEVTYQSSSRYSQWARRGGSSLELIHPDADTRQPANWADSDETTKAPWTTISATGRIDNGSSAADQLQVLLQAAGECLIDNVEVLGPSGGNRIANSGFETNSTGWTAEGTQSASSRDTTQGFNSSRSYHIRAVDRGDNQVNRVRTPLSSPLNSGDYPVTIRANVRWLKGGPEILLRLRGNWLECAGTMEVPRNPGTPGLTNSRRVTNAPPVLGDVQHSPVLPQSGEPITVTARVTDPDGIQNVEVRYRLDPNTTITSVAMRDDGTQGDNVAGDGVFSAQIPGQGGGTTVAFTVVARDALSGVMSGFPSLNANPECLILVGETMPSGNFPVYRVWMTETTRSTWANRSKLDNTPLYVTFALGNSRVIYGAQALYAGSPYIAPGYCGPDCGRCGYSLDMPADDLFLGGQALVLDWPGGHGGESSAMQEQMGWWIADQLDIPYSHRYTIRLFVNGVSDMDRGTVFEAVMQPAGDFIEAWSPNAPDGQFFKIDRAFEFSSSGGLIADPQPRLENFTTVNGLKKREKYRWNFLYRSTNRTSDYTNMFRLVDALNATSPESYTSATLEQVDVEEWMRIFATEQMIVNFDAYGHEIGKNMYAYLPEGGKWQLYMFDLDWLMLAAAGRGGSYAPGVASLFNADDPTIRRMYNHPPFRRAFFRAVKDALAGAFQPAKYNAVMDAKYASLVANGIQYCDGGALGTPAPVKAWFDARRTYLQSQVNLNDAAFQVTGHTVYTNVVVISGNAPLEATSLVVNGIPRLATWSSVTRWTIVVPLQNGTNTLLVKAQTAKGVDIAGAQAQLTVVYNGPEQPVVKVWINEWLADNVAVLPDPTDEDFEDWFELYNASTNSVDLAGYYLTDDPANPTLFRIPTNSQYVIPPKGYLLVWADEETDQNSPSRPDLHADFKLGKSGEFIGFYAPDGTPMDSVQFGAQQTDVSQGRYANGGTNFVSFPTPTPRAPNVITPPALAKITSTNGTLTFEVPTLKGARYQVEFAADLASGNWQPVGDVLVGNGNAMLTTLPLNGASRGFYRIAVVP